MASEIRRVLVTGDVTWDWNLARRSSDDPSSLQWDPGDAARMCPGPGGALLLARAIKEICSLPPSCHKPACSVEATSPEPSEPVPGTDEYRRFHNAYALWTPHPKCGAEGERWVWRVKQYLGLDPMPGDGRPVDNDPRKLESGDPERLDLVVLDDANLGFRKYEELWPDTIGDEAYEGWTLLKMSRKMEQSALWERLIESDPDRLVTVTTVDDLRHEAVQISRELSWERTAQDLYWNLIHNPAINMLSACAHTVVSLGPAGALLLSRDTSGGGWQCRLIFDPMVLERGWVRDYPGGTIGYMTSLTAGLVPQLLREEPDMIEGVRSGIAAMRAMHMSGYGDCTGKPALKPEFPFEAVAHAAVTKADDFADVDVRMPRRHLLASDTSCAGIPPTDTWAIIDDVLDPHESKPGELEPGQFHNELARKAADVAVHGVEGQIKDVPICSIGHLETVDRCESEGLRRVQRLIENYCNGSDSKPLAVAVFGPPGAGKSFGVKQVVKSVQSAMGADSATDWQREFNLSQFEGPDDLVAALHQVRDIGLSGTTPLVFWDEFDTALDNEQLGWLQYFLAPIQDGTFRDDGNEHHVGRAIFVFAGGTHSSMAEFDRDDEDFKSAKGPDLVSRLKGYLNVMGPNPQGDDDRHFILRRAILLRSMLERNTDGLFEGPKDDRTLSIDEGVLRAFLHISEYKHGARSMEAIISMSSLSGHDRFERSCLPDVSQLDLHVDGDEFMALVQLLDFGVPGPPPKTGEYAVEPPAGIEPETLELLAAAVHAVYRVTVGSSDARPEHAGKCYRDLPDDLKVSNRRFAREMFEYVDRIGYVVTPSRVGYRPVAMPDELIETMAEAEHERWMWERLDQGYRYGAENDPVKRTNPNLIPWNFLTEKQRKQRYGVDEARIGPGPMTDEQKQWDRDMVRSIPMILATAGYTLVPEGEVPDPLDEHRSVRIGVTGHRFLAEEETLRRAVDRALEFAAEQSGDHEIELISPLAEGADRMVAEAALEREIRLIAPLPFAKQHYLEDFESEESKAQFLELLDQADEVIELPPTEERNDAYAQVGEWVLDNSDAIIAIWDGQHAQGKGGTADVVERALQRGMPVLHIRAGNRKPGTNEPTTLGDAQGELVVRNL